MKHEQRGNTFVGIIIGIVIGLAAALAVAVYVTKVPVPFMNKGSLRSPEQDAAESRKNQNWDPNAPLYGKNPAKPLPPAPKADHAADMLRMLTGTTARVSAAAGLNTYLVTVSDHGLNASTFASRVVASTRAGLTSSALAALSALKGPLHGGAPGPVLDMLDAIGSPDRAEAWLEGALDRGDRLMGFGHRVYRVRDPRADALKAALKDLAADNGMDPDRLALAEAVEAAALAVLRRRKPDRPLETNVEFYTALLLEALGFPREAFTAVFATGRMAGWIAHAREQAATHRLIRPQSRYVGPAVSDMAPY